MIQELSEIFWRKADHVTELKAFFFLNFSYYFEEGKGENSVS